MSEFITVTDIKQNEKKASLFGIYTEDGFAFSLSDKGLFETGVSVGKQYTAEEFAEISAYATEEKVFRRAVYLLGNRDYGSEELVRKLADEGENGEKAVARLVELGYINDRAYAEKIIDRTVATYGVRRVKEELKKRFLSPEVWQDLLEEKCSQSEETVYDHLCIKARGKDLSDPREKQKIFAFFLRRGFLADDIRAAFRRYGQEVDDE